VSPTLVTILSFLVVLGVLIFVHELGHFLVARWYGVRVLTFSLGFGPKIVRFKRGDTEYCVSAIPLGGYVKMAGETVQDERQGAPDEFLSKSKWVRFQVYLAGPAMNVLLAVVALTVVLAGGADVPKYISSPAVIGRVDENSVAAKAGIQPGDRIVSVNGKDVPTWEAMLMMVIPKAEQELTIVLDRGGQRQSVKVVPQAESKYKLGTIGVHPVMRPQILGIRANTPAERVGLQRGDVILSIGGQTGITREDAIALIRKQGPNPIVLGIERAGQPIEITVTPEGPEGSSIIGFDFAGAEFDHIDPSLPEAFKLSLEKNWEDSRTIGSTLKGLITRETPVNQLLGPIAIADLSGSAAQLGWLKLLELMATISLNLALLNLMPVPVLDGGQIAILAFEGLTRRDMSIRVKERIAMVGAALILMLMVTVLYNDIARVLR
jgi:regulator of sigma E protease